MEGRNLKKGQLPLVILNNMYPSGSYWNTTTESHWVLIAVAGAGWEFGVPFTELTVGQVLVSMRQNKDSGVTNAKSQGM